MPGYRACDDTYCFFPYADLPPLNTPSETLDWLGPLDEATDQQMRVHRDRPKAPGQLPEIEATARQLGLSLPASFPRLIASSALQDRIPSGTACYFELGKAIVPYPGSQDGFIIRFLNDQQNVLTWYLYLTRNGANAVIVTPYWLEELAGVQGDHAPGSTLTATMGEGPDAVTWEIKSGPRYSEPADSQAIQRVVASTYVCGPSFVNFLYRYWLENDLFFKLSDAREAQLTEEERRYLAYYRNRAKGSDQPAAGTPVPVAPVPEAPSAESGPPPVTHSLAEGKARDHRSPAPDKSRGGAVTTRVFGLIGVVLGAAFGVFGAIPTGWFRQLNGVGGSGHLRADSLVAAGVVLLLLGIVSLVQPRRPKG